MQKSIIIAAGGQGMRFDPDRPKQFFYFRDRPMLMHVIDLFHQYDRQMQIIIGLPEEYFSYWDSICRQHRYDVCTTLSPGGSTRFETVKNALRFVMPGNLVGIHDSVRPLVYKSTIDRCYEAAAESGAAVPAIELKESIREVTATGNQAADRRRHRLVQTPQVFRYEILKKAFQQDYLPAFTDDAAVVEAAGHPITLVDGNHENIKVTTKPDLLFVEAAFDWFRKHSGYFR